MRRYPIPIGVALWLGSAVAAQAQPPGGQIDYQRCQDVQQKFIDARSRQDVAGMAATFAEDGVRVTPEGVFKGREAIAGNLQRLSAAGLRDFTAQRTVSWPQGELLFDAGEWHANLGKMSLHGYYSALLRCSGPEGVILEETTNVAVPSPR